MEQPESITYSLTIKSHGTTNRNTLSIVPPPPADTREKLQRFATRHQPGQMIGEEEGEEARFEMTFTAARTNEARLAAARQIGTALLQPDATVYVWIDPSIIPA